MPLRRKEAPFAGVPRIGPPNSLEFAEGQAARQMIEVMILLDAVK